MLGHSGGWAWTSRTDKPVIGRIEDTVGTLDEVKSSSVGRRLLRPLLGPGAQRTCLQLARRRCTVLIAGWPRRAARGDISVHECRA